MCDEHGLATGPDGMCIMCIRKSLRPSRTRATESGSRALTITVGVVALIALAIAVAFATGFLELGAAL